jgi:hypothetical protein
LFKVNTVLGSSLVESVVNKQKENIPPPILEEPISKRKKTIEYDEKYNRSISIAAKFYPNEAISPTNHLVISLGVLEGVPSCFSGDGKYKSVWKFSDSPDIPNEKFTSLIYNTTRFIIPLGFKCISNFEGRKYQLHKCSATRSHLVEKMASLCEKKNYKLNKFNKPKIMREYLEK